ncbi:hypothetical protein IWX65_003409 [Arthrobacter sp. CAN_A214]
MTMWRDRGGYGFLGVLHGGVDQNCGIGIHGVAPSLRWCRALGDQQWALSPDASMSVKRVETGVGADHSGAALVTGQRPLSPVVLAAGEACGAVADGGLSTPRARGREFPEEISDEGAPQGTSCTAGPGGTEGLDRPERTRTIRQDSSKNRKTLLQPELSEARAVGLGACRARPEPRVFRPHVVPGYVACATPN